jgi:hypothetical protein
MSLSLVKPTAGPPCPYHADTPRVCGTCGAHCHGSANGQRCILTHDPRKHDPDQQKPAVSLQPPQWYDDRDED